MHGNTGPQSQNTMEKENYDENKSAYSRNSITSTQFEKQFANCAGGQILKIIKANSFGEYGESQQLIGYIHEFTR